MTIQTDSRTVRDLVVEDYRTAAVFEKYGIDFCCNGNRSLDEACRAKGINPGEIEGQLSSVRVGRNLIEEDFDSWDPTRLTEYVVKTHHRYVKNVTPALIMYVKKVAAVHGENHPEMLRVRDLFEHLSAELASHMAREEQVLFPYIGALANAEGANKTVQHAGFGSVQNPIRMMMSEHEDAGNAFAEIQSLTHGYLPPDDACTTFRVTLGQLAEFERDLHKHVHLENNILFPRAIALEQELHALEV